MKAAAPGNPEVVDGYFSLPQGPGLGVKLNEDVINEHPQQRIFFNLFAENWHRRQALQSPPPLDKQTSHSDSAGEDQSKSIP